MSKTMSDLVAEAEQRFTQKQRAHDADHEKARVRRAQDVLVRMEVAKAALALEPVQTWPGGRWQIDDDGDVSFLFDYANRAFNVAFVPKSWYADGYWRVWCDGERLGNADAGHLAEWCAEWYVRAQAVQAERRAEVARELAAKEAVDRAEVEYDILAKSRDAGLNAATLTWLAERGIEVAGYATRAVPNPQNPQHTVTIVEPKAGATARIDACLPTGCWWLGDAWRKASPNDARRPQAARVYILLTDPGGRTGKTAMPE